MLSIGLLSKRSGVKIPTIRYYESVGIVSAPARSTGNQRRYTTDDLRRLNFIKHARDLGFSIETIRELIELADHADSSCVDADIIAKNQLVDVRSKIKKLKKLEKELSRIASTCAGGKVENCYVIQALADHSLCKDAH